MNKAERKKQIKEEMKGFIDRRKVLQQRLASLRIEIDHMKGHYDKTWEEEYGINSI